MKAHRFLPILIVLALLEVLPSISAQGPVSLFNSPLRFNGAQWQVESAIGPIYLARHENGSWRALAVFDGTNGKYFLNWENPTKGTYAAMDSQGTCSTVMQVGEGVSRLPASREPQHSCNLPQCHLAH